MCELRKSRQNNRSYICFTFYWIKVIRSNLSNKTKNKTNRYFTFTFKGSSYGWKPPRLVEFIIDWSLLSSTDQFLYPSSTGSLSELPVKTDSGHGVGFRWVYKRFSDEQYVGRTNTSTKRRKTRQTVRSFDSRTPRHPRGSPLEVS